MSPGHRGRDGAPVAEPSAPAGAMGAPGDAVTARGRLGADRAAAMAGPPSAGEANWPGGARDKAPPAPWSSDATEAPLTSEAATEAPPVRRRAGGRRGRAEADAGPPARVVDYHTLRNPFPSVDLWPQERVEAIHAAAFEVLDDLGMKVLLPEARGLYEGAGARVEGDMVHLPRRLVEDALAAAPRSVTLRAGRRAKDVVLKMGRLTIQTGAGAPHVTDRERGRRPADLAGFEELLKLTQSFDVLGRAAERNREAPQASVPVEASVDGGGVDVEGSGDLADGLAFAHELAGERLLVVAHLAGASEGHAARHGGAPAVVGAAVDEMTLELCDAGEHGEDHASRRAGGVGPRLVERL